MFGLLLLLGRALLRMPRAGWRALRRSLLLLPLREAPPHGCPLPPPVLCVRAVSRAFYIYLL
jgi:hypothetical protein